MAGPTWCPASRRRAGNASPSEPLGTLVEVVDALRRDPAPLVAAAAATPMTFVHGDWKLGNVGTGRDGRTVLIDWTYPG